MPAGARGEARRERVMAAMLSGWSSGAYQLPSDACHQPSVGVLSPSPEASPLARASGWVLPGYHFPSEAIHHPSPKGTSLRGALLARHANSNNGMPWPTSTPGFSQDYH